LTFRPAPPRALPGLFLPAAFVFAVVAFAWWRFSDNTADNDLWGHVLYGQRALTLGHVEKTDPFSWTAAGAPWINHEVLAERTLGWTHHLAGGTGLWLLSIATAVVTLFLTWSEVRRDAKDAGLGLTFAALLAVSTNGIALGFSARPQLATMLALVVLLGQMRLLYAGWRWALLTLPLLVLVWINSHGGVLAGLLLLGLAALITGVQGLVPSGTLARRFFSAPPRTAWLLFATALALSLAAALVTPWGPESLRWLIASVSYTRPEITEWQPTPVDFAHATFWFVAFLSLAAWLLSRRERRAWEAAALTVLLVMAWRHQRHIALFCLANLALTPPHLLDLLQRIRSHAAGLVSAFQASGVRLAATLLLLAAGAGALAASVQAPRRNPWTIEVERDQFPCAALHFLEAHPVAGNLLVFFDWGQQAMWTLPHNPVSFDGRFDTVYSRALIEAHWRFYRGESVDPAVLDLRRADVALLPSGCGGTHRLLTDGWTLVYWDPLACVLVRKPAANPPLARMRLPVRAGAEAVNGREPFPNAPSAWVSGATANSR
jgi:hypothetical protein